MSFIATEVFANGFSLQEYVEHVNLLNEHLTGIIDGHGGWKRRFPLDRVQDLIDQGYTKIGDLPFCETLPDNILGDASSIKSNGATTLVQPASNTMV